MKLFIDTLDAINNKSERSYYYSKTAVQFNNELIELNNFLSNVCIIRVKSRMLPARSRCEWLSEFIVFGLILMGTNADGNPQSLIHGEWNYYLDRVFNFDKSKI